MKNIFFNQLVNLKKSTFFFILFTILFNAEAHSKKEIFPIRSNDEKTSVNLFLTEIAQKFYQNTDNSIDFIIVAHLVPTLPYFLKAIENIGNIAMIVPKGSVKDDEIYEMFKDKIVLDKVTQKQKRLFFENSDSVIKLIQNHCFKHPFVIIDIGGYFSKVNTDLKKTFGDRFLGIVEDTENGHQKYEKCLGKTPIISIARNILKSCEDYNVGKSIVEASDAFLRKSNHTVLNRMKTIGIIGAGKIGTSIAFHLRNKGINRIIIYDKNPKDGNLSRLIQASSYGFEVVDKMTLLKESDMIFAATGNKSLQGLDFFILKDNVFIASCTSSDDEFDVSLLSKVYSKKTITKSYLSTDQYFFELGKTKKTINFLQGGNSINFVFNAVNGPYIYAVQANLIVAAKYLIDKKIPPSNKLGYIPIFGEVDEEQKFDMYFIAKSWLRHFEFFGKQNNLGYFQELKNNLSISNLDKKLKDEIILIINKKLKKNIIL